MLMEKVKHLRNTANWRTTELKNLIEQIDFHVKYHDLEKALKTIEKAHDRLNKMQAIINRLILDIHAQLEIKRSQICRQP